jgi:hypothetical protein
LRACSFSKKNAGLPRAWIGFVGLWYLGLGFWRIGTLVAIPMGGICVAARAHKHARVTASHHEPPPHQGIHRAHRAPTVSTQTREHTDPRGLLRSGALLRPSAKQSREPARLPPIGRAHPSTAVMAAIPYPDKFYAALKAAHLPATEVGLCKFDPIKPTLKAPRSTSIRGLHSFTSPLNLSAVYGIVVRVGVV